MAGLPAAAPLRSIRSELNRECQVRIKAGSGRPRPSPSAVVLLPPRTVPHPRANEPVSLCWLNVPSPFHPGSLNRPSSSRLRSSSRFFAVQQVIFFQLFPPSLRSPAFSSLGPPSLSLSASAPLSPSFWRALLPPLDFFSFSSSFRGQSIFPPGSLSFPRRTGSFLPAGFRSFSRPTACRGMKRGSDPPPRGSRVLRRLFPSRNHWD